MLHRCMVKNTVSEVCAGIPVQTSEGCFAVVVSGSLLTLCILLMINYSFDRLNKKSLMSSGAGSLWEAAATSRVGLIPRLVSAGQAVNPGTSKYDTGPEWATRAGL